MSATIYAKTKIVIDRDLFGQFSKRCDRAASETVQDLIDLGARTSRGMAPAGKHRERYAGRPGYIPLKKSIRTTRVGTGKRGQWFSIAPHAMFVEKDTNPHWIKGKLSFYWKKGKFVWENYEFGPRRPGSGPPGHSGSPSASGSTAAYKNWDFAGGAWVWHPGTNAQPFLEPAYDRVVRRQAMEIAARHYPG